METKTPSTGNEGLDAEKAWRDKAAMCEHPNIGLYVADEKDDIDPMLCDVAGSSDEEKGRSNLEKTLYPVKYAAVSKSGDSAFYCRGCHMIICDNCR